MGQLTKVQQVAILLFDRFIALARTFAQTFNVEDLDFSARVFDHASFLQSACNGGDARPPDAKHLSQELLGEGKVITPRQIAGAQKPAAEPSINFMICHAGCRLLRLREQRLLMSHDNCKQALIATPQPLRLPGHTPSHPRSIV